MSDLKRLPVKYLRDYIKKDYKLRDCCFICGSVSELELHHLYSVSELFERWCVKNRVKSIDSVEEIMVLRVKFATDCSDELSHTNLYTLCKPHHQRLHSLYGKSYSNYMALKVRNWLHNQREQYGEVEDGKRTDRVVSGQA
jgi:5-methylcytosine-specific restriction endonuclease McrA